MVSEVNKITSDTTFTRLAMEINLTPSCVPSDGRKTAVHVFGARKHFPSPTQHESNNRMDRRKKKRIHKHHRIDFSFCVKDTRVQHEEASDEGKVSEGEEKREL